MVGSPRKRSHAEATANASSSGTNAVENGKEAKRVEESTLDKLKKHSIVVADTGDFNQLKTFAPQDATTNPTLIYQAIQMPAYAHLLDEAIEEAKKQVAAGGGGGKKKEKDKEKNEEDALVDEICDRLSVKFGIEILKIVPGVVSSEVNASLSFDTQGSIEKARKLIGLYESAGVDRKRVLIKMATTWEGCKAATVLEKEKIHVNMTLLFSLTQAICAAEANATLISPFVGRILDWHVKKFKEEQKKDDKNKSDKGPDYLTDSSKDPGVLSVQKIYKYYKKFGYKTIIMGASFRNTGEIINLSGCDKLTIAPKLLDELNKSSNDAPAILSEKMEFPEDMQKIHLDEKNFRWQLNEDQMATEKLSEGIRNFNADLVRLKNLVKEKLKEKKK